MIGLHAVAMLAGFCGGAFVTLWADSDGAEDREVFGWCAVGANVAAVIFFAAAVSL